MPQSHHLTAEQIIFMAAKLERPSGTYTPLTNITLQQASPGDNRFLETTY